VSCNSVHSRSPFFVTVLSTLLSQSVPFQGISPTADIPAVLIFVPRDTQTPRVPSQHIQLTYRFNIGMMVTLGLFHFVCNMRCIHAFDKRQEGANVFEKCDQRASPRRSPLLPSVSTIRHIRVLFMRQVFDRYQQDPLCKDRK